MFVLTVSIPCDIDDIAELNDTMDEAMQDADAALLGTGYSFVGGMRDYSYGFVKPVPEQLIADLKGLFTNADISVDEEDDDDYGE